MCLRVWAWVGGRPIFSAMGFVCTEILMCQTMKNVYINCMQIGFGCELRACTSLANVKMSASKYTIISFEFMNKTWKVDYHFPRVRFLLLRQFLCQIFHISLFLGCPASTENEKQKSTACRWKAMLILKNKIPNYSEFFIHLLRERRSR